MTRESKKKRRVRNPTQTRAKLLQATVDLVSDKGLEALSLKEAAQKANLSRGVAYQHFRDRDHLLSEAKAWISGRLQDGVTRFVDAPMHDRVLYTTKLVLENPVASKLMIADALAGRDLDPHHPLYKLVMKMLRQLIASGSARADIDLEIMTYIMLGTIATTIMLGEQHKGGDLDALAERFTKEWRHILRDGIFAKGPARRISGKARSGQGPRPRSKPRSRSRS
ncbi:MAG TPA: TetR/AcrR family transcriptional regulator [Steroidobacteraceae bacterium]|nr:TetR/AcrR family transcriptional regulator [Steroidobacteraceae bacterium]